MGKIKIAILYIALGKYDVFWKEFYCSAEKKLLKNCEKEYYVFSDSQELMKSAETSPSVHIIPQQDLGWPNDTLLRFAMFSRIIEELERFDYIFFFNANMVFISEIMEDDILPVKEDLVFASHPGLYDKSREEFTYDRNCNSNAYIPYGEGEHYICGGVNGGKSEAYIKLIKEINNWTLEDLAKGVMPLWHDESYLNKYALGKKYKLLSPGYVYYKEFNLPFEEKIRLLDKQKWIHIEKYNTNKSNVIMSVLNQMLILSEKGKNLSDYLHKNRVTSVAIYGMGIIGQRVFANISASDVEVKYVIDRNEKISMGDTPVCKPDDKLENVDMVIVTTVQAFRDIKEHLERNNCALGKIVHISYILEEELTEK